MEAIGAHAQGLQEAADAAASPDYLTWLKSLVNLLDHAMEAEGIDAEVRDRVVSRVYYGSPTLDVEKPERTGPPMNAGASVRRTLAEPR